MRKINLELNSPKNSNGNVCLSCYAHRKIWDRGKWGKWSIKCHPEAIAEGSSQNRTPRDSSQRLAINGHGSAFSPLLALLRITDYCHPELVSGSQERAPFAILRHAKNDEKCPSPSWNDLRTLFPSPRGRVPEGQEGVGQTRFTPKDGELW